jgi:hypothetical protein
MDKYISNRIELVTKETPVLITIKISRILFFIHPVNWMIPIPTCQVRKIRKIVTSIS